MRIMITGSNGLIGSAVKNIVNKRNHNHDFFFVARKDADLSKEDEVKNLFEQVRPDYVINTAASVGGMGGNINHHAEYFYNNTLINSYIIHYCYLYNVKKLLCMSSTCVFPIKFPEFNEDLMHEGPLFESHFAYGYSKRMIDVQIRAYKQQYKINNYTCIIPGNVFGPDDSFNLIDGHVIASLIHKCYLAKKTNTPFVIWGDGTAQREFIFSYDLAKIMLDLLDSDVELPTNLLVSSDTELYIKELVATVCKVADYTNVVWDTTKSNGQMRKKSDTSLLKRLLPDVQFTDFEESIKITWDWFCRNYESARK